MLALAQRLLEAESGGAPVVVASVLEAGPRPLAAGSRLLVERSGETMGTLGDPALDALAVEYAATAFRGRAGRTLYVSHSGLSERALAGATSVFVEVVSSKPAFVVVGAGHIGRCLARLARLLGFHVAVIDDREDFASPEAIPEADQVICGDFAAVLDEYPVDEDTSLVMVTRGHRQDEESLRHCLGRGAGYVGMIGSKRRTATVLAHLREEGFDPEELARVRTPIGLDLGAETPEEIALSIMAEVVMLRRGGTGKPMYYRAASRRERRR